MINQEHLAQIFQRLLQSGSGEELLTTGERFKTVTIAFPQHYYTISRRGPKIYVTRLGHNSARLAIIIAFNCQFFSAETFVNSSSNTAAANSSMAEVRTREDPYASINSSRDSDAHEKADSDNESTTSTNSSSSIATVKSEHQESDDDQPHGDIVDNAVNSSVFDESVQEPTSIESSIQRDHDKR